MKCGRRNFLAKIPLASGAAALGLCGAGAAALTDAQKKYLGECEICGAPTKTINLELVNTPPTKSRDGKLTLGFKVVTYRRCRLHPVDGHRVYDLGEVKPKHRTA